MLAAFHMIFFGTQPTLTQVPPKRSGLDHRGLRAVFGRALRAGEAAAAAADADEIERSLDTVNSVAKATDLQ